VPSRFDRKAVCEG